jgi:hypothetical protein
MGGGLAVAAFHDASFQVVHLRTRSDQPYDRIIADDNPEVPATERPDRAPADEGSGVRHGVVYIRFLSWIRSKMPQNGIVVERSKRMDQHSWAMGIAGGYRKWIIFIPVIWSSRQERGRIRFEILREVPKVRL